MSNRIYITFLFVILAMAFTSPVRAKAIEFSPYLLLDLKKVAVNQAGQQKFDSVTTIPNTSNYIGFIGILPTNTMISFSYMSHNFDPDHGAVASNGHTPGYSSYTSKANKVWPSSGVNSPVMTSDDNFFLNGNPLIPLAFTSAQLDPDDPSRATAYIKNNSSGDIYFSSTFEQLFTGEKKPWIQAHYKVTATPIPAALPMFALGLAGLAGIRTRKKAKKLPNSLC